MNTSFINSYLYYGTSQVLDENRRPHKTHNSDRLVVSGLFRDNKSGCLEFLNNFLTSLFIHDTTFIRARDLFLLFDLIGIKNTILVLKTGAVKMIDDNGITPTIFLNQKGENQFGYLENCEINKTHTQTSPFDSTLAFLEYSLTKSSIGQTDKNLILFHLEKYSSKIDLDEFSKRLKSNFDYDLNNKNLYSVLGIKDNNLNAFAEHSLHNIIRLAQCNQTIIYSALIDTNNIICEAETYNLLKVKYSNLTKSVNHNSIETFENIASKIGLPNFCEIILNRILTVEEFLELRSKKGSQKFRNWMLENEFNQDLAISYLLKDEENNNVKTKIIQSLRWAFVNSIGFFEPFTGLGLSAVDSFVADKFVKGWTPKLFLNNELKSLIDKKEKSQKKNQSTLLINKYFPKTGRNEQCPCESGKKFKNCCGK